jgi:hypothetical protein
MRHLVRQLMHQALQTQSVLTKSAILSQPQRGDSDRDLHHTISALAVRFLDGQLYDRVTMCPED